MHSSLINLGYPDNVVFENNSWVVLLRKKQVTLGSCVVITKRDESRSFSSVGNSECEDMLHCIRIVEGKLSNLFECKKFNYFSLMMKDPHFHFHVIPRYPSSVFFMGTEFYDYCYPSPPILSKYNQITDEVYARLLYFLKEHFML